MGFHYVAWVISLGWDLGVLGAQNCIFFLNMVNVAYQIEGNGEYNVGQDSEDTSKIFTLGSTW